MATVPGRSHLLDASGHVDGEAVELLGVAFDVDEAAVDADAGLELGSAVVLRQRREGTVDLQPRPHRAEGVILVGGRIAEDREEPVAADVHEVPVELVLDDAATGVLVGRDQAPVGLRIQPLRERCRSHQVAEHDGETTQLVLGGRLGVHPVLGIRCRCLELVRRDQLAGRHGAGEQVIELVLPGPAVLQPRSLPSPLRRHEPRRRRGYTEPARSAQYLSRSSRV